MTRLSHGINPSRWTTVGRWGKFCSARAVLIGWIAAGVLIVFTTQLCNTIWAISNPAPHHWDNADYLNMAWQDYWSYQYGGPVADPVHHPDVHRTGVRGVWDSLLHNDPNRPPGLRVVSLPFVFLGTKMLPTLRMMSLLCFWLTLWLVYKTVRTVVPGPGGITAAIAAIMALSLDLEVGWSIRVFGTEYVLYLSVALAMYALARAAVSENRSHWTWILLGLSLGLGMLSKVSFVMLAGPAGLVAMSMALTGRLPGLSVKPALATLRLAGAALIGTLICGPYYRYHIFTVLKYGQDMTEFTRHSLNKTGLEFIHAWVSLHFNEGLGPGASIVCFFLALLGIPAVVIWLRKNWRAIPTGTPVVYGPAGRVFLLGLAAGLPLPLFQMVFSQSSNHRHITPAYFPLTISLAVAAGMSGAMAVWWSWPILIAVFIPACWQIWGFNNLATPPYHGTARYLRIDPLFIDYTTTADDVWDWEPLYQLLKGKNVRFPYIGRVGNGGQFNEPSIEAPWVSRGDWAYGVWLWKPEFGPYDWNAVKAKLDAEKITVVVTARQMIVKADGSRLAEPVVAENAHNDEFADQMQTLPNWTLIGKFPIGRVNKAQIWVFQRKPSM
jgi:hypothetical protein